MPVEIKMRVAEPDIVNAKLAQPDAIKMKSEQVIQGGGAGGTTDYNLLDNLPSINGVTVAGSKSGSDYGLVNEEDIPTKTSDLTNDSGFVNADAGNAYRALSIPMGALDSGSTATVMSATVPGITELRDGVCVWLKNGVITSASGVTLNINGLGAKPLYSSLAAASRSTTIFNINYTLLLVYNSTRVEGGCWDVVYGIDTNTTYTPYSLGFGYGTCTTAAATAAKVASVSSSYKLTGGGIVAVKFSEDVPANATLNINSKGAKAIYYKGAAITAGVIKAGDTVTMCYSTYYHILAIDRDGYEKPSTGIPASDLASAVQTSLGKADTALQSVPSTYRTAAAQDTIDSGKLDIAQGAGNAGKFMVVGSDGNITAVTMQTWQGGSY